MLACLTEKITWGKIVQVHGPTEQRLIGYIHLTRHVRKNLMVFTMVPRSPSQRKPHITM